MKEVVAELDYVPVATAWSIRPVFWVPREEPNAKVEVVIHLFHSCPNSTKRNPQREHCGLTNKDEFLAGDLPEYACNHCGEEAPAVVVEEKLLAASNYKGYDPRNNRRAAVLATKNKGTKNVG